MGHGGQYIIINKDKDLLKTICMQHQLQKAVKETLINCLCGRIAALRGARNLNIFIYMPRFLRSVRLALHPAQTINQGFLNAVIVQHA